MSQSRPSGRGQDPRRRTTGSGPRGAVPAYADAPARRRDRAPAPAPSRRPAAAHGAARPDRPAPPAHRPGRDPGAGPRGADGVLRLEHAGLPRAAPAPRRARAPDISASRAKIADLQREKKRWNDPAYVAHRRAPAVRLGAARRDRLPGARRERQAARPHRHAVRPGLRRPAANRPQWWQSAWGSVVTAGKPAGRRRRTCRSRSPRSSRRRSRRRSVDRPRRRGRHRGTARAASPRHPRDRPPLPVRQPRRGRDRAAAARRHAVPDDLLPDLPAGRVADRHPRGVRADEGDVGPARAATPSWPRPTRARTRPTSPTARRSARSPRSPASPPAACRPG